MNNKVFDPEKSFFELPIVKWTFGIIIALATITTVIIIMSSTLSFNPSYIGFNQLVTIFKVPIGILAIAIPIVAVYATNHRSEQFKEQMKVANNQNNFSNYYKHIEEFEKYLVSHTSEPRVEITQIRTLHKKIFDRSNEGDFTISKNTREHLRISAIKVVEKIKAIEKTVVEDENIKSRFNEIRDLATEMLGYFQVKYSTNWGLVSTETNGNHSEYTSVKHWFDTLIRHFEIANNILLFGQIHQPIKEVSYILNLNTKAMEPGVDALFADIRFLKQATTKETNLWEYLRKL